MTPQPHTYPDAHIDQVLNALRSTQPPAGLEERIAARLAQAAEARIHSATASASPARAISSFFALILSAIGVPGRRSLPAGVRVEDPRILPTQAKLYATAATALTLLVTLTILHNRTPTTPSAATTQVAQNSSHETPRIATNQVAQGFSLGSHTVERNAGVLTPALSQATTNHVPQDFSLGSHKADPEAGVLTPVFQQQPDPDAIALAETRAPTLAAPPMPLTPQEQLIASATRPGQPIQLAELATARQPFLQAEAKARTDANIQRYVRTLLAPFAVADALQPNTVAEPQEISTSAPAPQPPPSLSN